MLKGQLDFPDNSSPNNLPCVVVVSGSGPQDRDGYFGDSGTERDLLYRDLSQAFIAAGFAVLRWDYRGVFFNEMTMPGRETCTSEYERAMFYLKHGADWIIRGGVTPENILDDIEVIYGAALEHPRINPERIVILAHSEGVTNVAQLIKACRIAPAGILNLCGISTSPKEVLRWQCVDRYVERVLSWDRDGDGQVTTGDAEAALANDTFFTVVGFSKEELTPSSAWDSKSLQAFFGMKFKALAEETLNTPDETPYPKPSGEPGLVMGSYRWFKRYFLDDRAVIELLKTFQGNLVFHFGAIDAQLPSMIQLETAKTRLKQFDGRLRLVLHDNRGHVLRTGHPSMGPMDLAAVKMLVNDAVALLSPNKALLPTRAEVKKP